MKWFELDESFCTRPPLNLVHVLLKIVSAGGILAFTTHMKRSELPLIRKECVWALSNIAISNSDHVQRLVTDGVFKEVGRAYLIERLSVRKKVLGL